jgi:Domain of unknown function (DUF4397)
MNRYSIAVAAIGAIALAACDKNEVRDITAPVSGANVRFLNLGANAPGVNFFANDTKVTAVASTNCSPPPTTPNPACTTTGAETQTGTAFGALANGGLYNVIPAGSVQLAGKIATATDNGVAVASATANLENGKYYSFYTSGIYDATAKKMDAFVVEDPLPAFNFTKAYVRFVNASSNASGLTLYAKNVTTAAEVPVGAAVAYKAAGVFMPIDSGSFDLNLRPSAAEAAVVTLTAVSFAANRVYTVSLRGNMTVTSTTAADRPIMQSDRNR